MVAGHLVPHNWSPIDWSLMTNGHQPIQSPWTNGSKNFDPHGQMVPKNLVPMDKWSPTNSVPLDNWSLEYSNCPGGQAVGIWKYWNHIGWGPFVRGHQIFGNHLSMGTELVRDRLSRGTNKLGTNCGGPNVQGPYVFETKCVTAFWPTLVKIP